MLQFGHGVECTVSNYGELKAMLSPNLCIRILTPVGIRYTAPSGLSPRAHEEHSSDNNIMKTCHCTSTTVVAKLRFLILNFWGCGHFEKFPNSKASFRGFGLAVLNGFVAKNTSPNPKRIVAPKDIRCLSQSTGFVEQQSLGPGGKKIHRERHVRGWMAWV